MNDLHELTRKRLEAAKQIHDIRRNWEGFTPLPAEISTLLDQAIASFVQTGAELGRRNLEKQKTINKPTMQACFVNTNDKPIQTNHVAWKVGTHDSLQYGRRLILQEVVIETYNHPDTDQLCIRGMIKYDRRAWPENQAPAIIKMLQLTQESVRDNIASLLG